MPEDIQSYTLQRLTSLLAAFPFRRQSKKRPKPSSSQSLIASQYFDVSDHLATATSASQESVVDYAFSKIGP